MKILHFISGGDTGGAKTHVLTLLPRLLELGVEVELLCIMEGIFTEEARKLNIPVNIILQKRRYDMTVIKKIGRFINERGYDIVHCHGARANYIAAFIRKKINAVMITTLHSDYKLDFKDTLYKQIIYAPINYFALKRFKYILTVTEAFKNMMVRRGFREDKFFVVYNGIDFSVKPSFIPKNEFFEKYSVDYDENKKYVGIAARLNAVKGIDIFLKMAFDICGKKDDVNFVIAGNGDDFNKFNSLIKEGGFSDRIFMIGHIDDIDSFFNAIDVNMLTSLSESFPYALLEGARMKKATVSTGVGGIPEMILNGKTGFLVSPYDVSDMSEKVLKLISDENLAGKFGQAFFEHARKNFSDVKMAETHKSIYEKIVKENEK